MSVVDRANRKIVPTTDALISLFRQTIGTAETVIPLREELECVKNYVFLQQMRTGHGLELTVHQSENTAEALVPKLLLQPIVENAVFHGIEPRGTDGRITVFVSKAGSILNIEIDDDGVGMDENTLREFEHASGGGARFSGVGINNIRERIRLMYGEEYGISITSQPGMGTQIVIRIPYYTDKGGFRLYKLLIVEDEMLLRQGIVHMLNWTEHDFLIVGQVSNGKEALECIDTLKPDIIITDIIMPVMDGVEFTRRVKNAYPEIQIVVLSSYDDFPM